MSASKKKKILFVRPNMGTGGADRVTISLLKYLKREEFDISLVLMHSKGKLMHMIPEDVDLIVPEVRNLAFYFWPLFKLLKKGEYDIVYSTCGGASMPLSLASRMIRLKSFKLILSERNILRPYYKGKLRIKLFLALKRIGYKGADFVTAVSKGVGQEIIEVLGVPPHKVKVVNNPIVDEKFTALSTELVEHKWFNSDCNVILAVGRLVEQKDYPTLLQAFSRVNSQQANTRLVILGDGPLKGWLSEMCKELDIIDLVDFKGYVINPFPYMKSAKVFVLSSKHEGMPGVLVQAMASGTAVVSTDCPTGPNELIVHGENGYLVKVGDSIDMAAKLMTVLNTEELRLKFRKNAPKAVECFEKDEAIRTYLEFI